MRNPKSLASVALILILAWLGWHEMHSYLKPLVPDKQAYFYNLETKALFSASDNLLPPIATPSGPDTGVRAYVFSCDGSTNTFVAYLEKMTPDGRTAALVELKNDKSPAAMGFFKDRHPDAILVRTLKDETWYPKFSPAGTAVMTAGKNSGGCDHPVASQP